MYKLFIFISVVLFATNAFASGSVDGKVKKIRVDTSGQTMIYFDKEISISGANCRGVAYKYVFAIDTNTDAGKAALSVALAAKLSSTPVEAVGKMNCNIYGDGVAETLDHIVIK